MNWFLFIIHKRELACGKMLVICLHVISLKLHNNYFCASYIFLFNFCAVRTHFPCIPLQCIQTKLCGHFQGVGPENSEREGQRNCGIPQATPSPPPPQKRKYNKKRGMWICPRFSVIMVFLPRLWPFTIVCWNVGKVCCRRNKH